MCESNTGETDRFEKYKPNLSRAKGRETCPADGLTLNDVHAIDARGQYRDAIDSKLSSDALANRSAASYRIESLPEADALVEACDMVLHADASDRDACDLTARQKKAVHRVKSDAKEIARGLRAAVDELDTTENHPDSRRPVHTETRNRGFDAKRVRTDGGREQQTLGRADVRKTDAKCNKIVRVESGEAIICDNTGRYAVEAGGKVERRCGVHISDIEAVIQ